MLVAKIVLWVFCLLPAARLVHGAFTDNLTANPIEYITHQTGFWALTLLMVTLAVTPIRRITGWNRIIQLRRPLGLFAFFYLVLHFLTYVSLDRWFDFSTIAEDIAERPYITVGFTAFLLLIPLAVTSTKGWIRRLGKRWTLIHRAIYISAALGVLHFYWKKSAKSDTAEPLLFAAILGVLLLARVVIWLLKRRNAPRRAARQTATTAPNTGQA
jgi:sulfoxide reductase heme-binding subunit YedZ